VNRINGFLWNHGHRVAQASIMVVLMAGVVVACKGSEKQRHLRCADGEGNVVVDTTDLNRAPTQYENAWSWSSEDGSTYTEVSVPPHSCVYQQTQPGEQPTALVRRETP